MRCVCLKQKAPHYRERYFVLGTVFEFPNHPFFFKNLICTQCVCLIVWVNRCLIQAKRAELSNLPFVKGCSWFRNFNNLSCGTWKWEQIKHFSFGLDFVKHFAALIEVCFEKVEFGWDLEPWGILYSFCELGSFRFGGFAPFCTKIVIWGVLRQLGSGLRVCSEIWFSKFWVLEIWALH